MAGQAGSRLRGLVTMSGMVAFLGAMVRMFDIEDLFGWDK